MKVQGNSKPIFEFTVINYDGTADLIFRENIEDISPESAPATLYQWDEFHLSRPWTVSIYDEVTANYSTWLNAAKLEDEMRTPVDMYQLRADVDYQGVMLQVMSPISLMPVSAGSDPEVLEMARKYYPLRWSESRLRVLVAANKLTASDFESITGTAYDNDEEVV